MGRSWWATSVKRLLNFATTALKLDATSRSPLNWFRPGLNWGGLQPSGRQTIARFYPLPTRPMQTVFQPHGTMAHKRKPSLPSGGLGLGGGSGTGGTSWAGPAGGNVPVSRQRERKRRYDQQGHPLTNIGVLFRADLYA